MSGLVFLLFIVGCVLLGSIKQINEYERGILFISVVT